MFGGMCFAPVEVFRGGFSTVVTTLTALASLGENGNSAGSRPRAMTASGDERGKVLGQFRAAGQL